MPTAAMHVCAGAGCRAAVPHGERWCPACAREYQAQDRERRGSARERGYTSRWDRYALALRGTRPICAECEARGRVRPTQVIDHVIPHRGDQELFWATWNHDPLCKRCHDHKTATRDAGFGGAALLPDFPRPLVPLSVVAGPPAAGKTTYVREYASPGDLVLDLDDIKRARGLGMRPALAWRNARLAELGTGPRWPAAWLIITAPLGAERAFWRMRGARVILLDTPLEVCLARLAERGPDAERLSRVARYWWRRRTSDPWTRPAPNGEGVTLTGDGVPGDPRPSRDPPRGGAW